MLWQCPSDQPPTWYERCAPQIMKVLLLESETDIRLLLQFNLERDGIAVVEASDPSRLPQLLAAEKPDVALINIVMPPHGGLGVAYELRQMEATRDLPIVLLSSLTEVCERVRRLEIPDIDCLQLPFDPARVAPFLREFLARAKARGTATPEQLRRLWAPRAGTRPPRAAEHPELPLG